MSKQRWFELPVKLIVSTGRTGTQFLAEFFNKFLPRSAGLHEPEPDLLSVAIGVATRGKKLENALSEIRVARKMMMQKILKGGGNCLVEANNRYFSLLPLAREIYSNLRIVHIIRDGRDYVRSGMSRPQVGHWYSARDPHAKNDLRLKATMFPEDPYYECWSELNAFQKITWRWVKKDSFIRKDVRDKEDSLTLHFESIFNREENYPGLRQMIDFLDLPRKIDPTDSQVREFLTRPSNETKEYNIPHWTNWSEKRKKQFDEIAAEQMKKYGYYE